MSELFVSVNHEIIPESKASLQISDLSIQRGYGIFDFFKTIDGRPVFLEEHFDRFFRSAEQMRLPIGKDRHELKEALRVLMDKNGLPQSGIRMTLTGGYSPDGYTLSVPNLVITQRPLQLPPQDYFTKGTRLVSYPHVRQMPDTKTIDYLMAIWLQPFIREKGADDVLYHQNGIITECPRSNFFMVTADDQLVTPGHNILRGVIRSKLITLAGKQFQTEERDISLTEALTAKEAFITSTTKHILPVLQLDGTMIGNGQPGKVSEWLLGALEKNIKQSSVESL